MAAASEVEKARILAYGCVLRVYQREPQKKWPQIYQEHRTECRIGITEAAED